MAENTIQIENLVELAIMGYSDLTKLDGIESVRTFRTAATLQLYIICDNGDVIQVIYLCGTNSIYATLVGMHCSNNASILVCRDKYAREDLIRELMDETLYPVISSNRLSYEVIFSGYLFWRRGHVVYYLKMCSMDIQKVKYTFCGLIKDILRKHSDGILLDVTKPKINRLPPEEIKEEWILC